MISHVASGYRGHMCTRAKPAPRCSQNFTILVWSLSVATHNEPPEIFWSGIRISRYPVLILSEDAEVMAGSIRGVVPAMISPLDDVGPSHDHSWMAEESEGWYLSTKLTAGDERGLWTGEKEIVKKRGVGETRKVEGEWWRRTVNAGMPRWEMSFP